MIRFLLVAAVCLGSYLNELTAEEREFRILAFGDSNTWGWIPDGSGTRYADGERWTGILEAELGESYTVVCDGLVARRTNLDGLQVGPIEGSFLNGAKTLPAAIARNAPIDLVILFLGTNDLQAGAERNASEVAEAVGTLAELVTQSENLLYASYPAPQVMVVIPPPLGDLSASSLQGLFEVGYANSQHLSTAFKEADSLKAFSLIDTQQALTGGIGPDGIHLNITGHLQLGQAIAKEILKLNENR